MSGNYSVSWVRVCVCVCVHVKKKALSEHLHIDRVHGRGLYIIFESIRFSAYSLPFCRAVE